MEEAEARRTEEQQEEEGWANEEEEEEGEEEEDEEDDDDDDEEDGVIVPMPGQDLVSVGVAAVGTGEMGFCDGAAAVAMFRTARAMLHLPDGRVLVADRHNQRIRVLSADLQQVSTVAGDGEEGDQDGAAAHAQFYSPTGFALLPDGRILVADQINRSIRVLSADLQQVSTVAGDGDMGHRDGAAAQAQFYCPTGFALLPDGCVEIGRAHV